MAQLPALPNSPVGEELQRRLLERLADLKGDYSNTFAPNSLPTPNSQLPTYSTLLLPGTLSLTPQPAAFLQTYLPQLRPDGAVLGYVLGESSFPELRSACHAANFTPPPALPAVQDVGSLLQRHKLALPVVDRDFLTLTFSSFTKLMNFLQSHHALLRPPGSGLVTPRRWQRLAAAYPVRPDGKLPLTLEIIFFHALQPSAHTPKAAPRGSGKVSLVKILGSDAETPCQTLQASAPLPQAEVQPPKS
jgi:hypothetical protein